MRYPRLQSVLLIDDNPNDRLLARRELAKAFDTLIVHEVLDQKGLDRALSGGDFDLVITDYQLGWSDGLKILRTVKSQRSQCPVIMFTNTGTQEIAVAAMKSGLSDYVIKSPRHFIRLRQAVRSVWQQFQTQLRAAQLEVRLQALLDQLEVGIFRATPAGQLLDVNVAMLNMLAVSSVKAAQTVLGPQLKAAFSEKEASRVTELGFTRADQSSLWLKVIATLHDINGELIVDGIVEDVTARKQAEQQLNQLNQTLEEQVQSRTLQLETINQELEMFAYSISHDLRSPIRQINGFINLIQHQLGQTVLDDKVQHYFEVILGLTRQSSDMIDALLNFSQSGRVEMSFSPVETDRMVRQISSQIDESSSAPSINWQIAALPDVVGDRQLIKLVWQNLIGNAVKFTQQQPQPTIVIQAKTQAQAVVFSISDNGIGFDSEQSDSIFGMFQRAHSQKTVEGVGVGLANVKRIVSRHGGRVWAEGKVGQGASFYFSLPSGDKTATDRAPAPSQ